MAWRNKAAHSYLNIYMRAHIASAQVKNNALRRFTALFSLRRRPYLLIQHCITDPRQLKCITPGTVRLCWPAPLNNVFSSSLLLLSTYTLEFLGCLPIGVHLGRSKVSKQRVCLGAIILLWIYRLQLQLKPRPQPREQSLAQGEEEYCLNQKYLAC